jgi:Fe2+ or Zn2+ uptake regulation protein
MTKTFAESVRELRRLALLQLLDEAPQYQASVELLYQAIPGRTLAASYDQVYGDVQWLCEQGLVTTETLVDTVLARITMRGSDVARGLAEVPGVSRPRPLQ